jgi:predicted amidohydrolase
MLAATIQFCPQFKEPEVNLRRAAELVIRAAKAGATLIALPELCTTGYSFMSAAEAEPYAEVFPDSRSMEVFGTLARKFNVNIAWGVMTNDSGVLHNSQVLVTPDGGLAKYSKVNPWGQDFCWATPGTSNPPITVIGGKKVGLLICRDVRDKATGDWDSFYEPGDADVVLLAANWGAGGFPAVTWMDFARDNNCILCVSNRYGHEANNNFGDGGVCIIYPDQRVVCEGLVWSQDCIVYGDV